MQRAHSRPMLSQLALSLSLIGLMVGCTQITPLKPDLTIQVQPAGADGYTVSGTTNLPGKPRILVQAIRKLLPNANAGVNRSPTYAIVAQQWVDAPNGNWQATLKLLQASENPATNGGLLESWQQHPTESITATTAEPQVTFIASTTPINRDLRLEGDTEVATNANLRSEILQVAADGNRYLKVQQALMIPPPVLPNPTIAQLPPVVLAKVNAIREPGDAKKQEKTDAPLPQSAYLR